MLIGARILAGCCGGPATSIALAIVSDVVPPERRGKAIGKLMGSFSIASVLGVPAGLEIARLGNWQSPFYAVGLLGLIVAALAYSLLPKFISHLNKDGKKTTALPLRSLLARKEVALSFVMTAVVMFSLFLIVPNIAAYIQINLDYPRDKVGALYMMGGVASFFSMLIAGRLTDKAGALLTGTLGSLGVIISLYFGFAAHALWMTPPLIFIGFMSATALRNVAYNTICSKIPKPAERAAFLSFQSSIQHLSTASGAFVSTRLLTTSMTNKLEGIDTLAWIAIMFAITLPLLMGWVIQLQIRANSIS